MADCLGEGAGDGAEGVGDGVGPFEAASGEGVLQDLEQEAVGAGDKNQAEKLQWRTKAVGQCPAQQPGQSGVHEDVDDLVCTGEKGDILGHCCRG